MFPKKEKEKEKYFRVFFKLECELFDRMPERDVISFSTLLAGYALQGWVNEAIKGSNEMDDELCHNLFDRLPERDVISFSNLLVGYDKFALMKR